MNKKKLVLTALAATALAGCASTDPTTGASRDQIIAVQYGTLKNIEQVAMAPSYGKGAALGGGLGLLAASSSSSGTQVGAAVAGALLGAFISKETSGTAQKYSVQLVNGNNVAIVTEHHDLTVGDCVSVEQGQHANIRRVSPVMCSTPASHAAYPDMHAAVQQESAECHQAKQELMKASTEQQTDIGYKKMRAFCEH